MDGNPSHLMSRVEQGVTIVQFTDPKVVGRRDIKLIGAELTKMVEENGVLKMLVNVKKLQYLSSAVLGKLISLHKSLRTNTGVLKLCNVAPTIYEAFEITRLNKIFDIYKSEAQALEAFMRQRR